MSSALTSQLTDKASVQLCSASNPLGGFPPRRVIPWPQSICNASNIAETILSFALRNDISAISGFLELAVSSDQSSHGMPPIF
jgi:hypothetical protein